MAPRFAFGWASPVVDAPRLHPSPPSATFRQSPTLAAGTILLLIVAVGGIVSKRPCCASESVLFGSAELWHNLRMQMNPNLRHSLFWKLRFQAWFSECYWTATIDKTDRTAKNWRTILLFAGCVLAVPLFFLEMGWWAGLIVFLLTMANRFVGSHATLEAVSSSMQEKGRWSKHRHEVDEWWEYGESKGWENDADIDQAYAKLSEFQSVTVARDHKKPDADLANECMDKVEQQFPRKERK